MSDKSFVTLAQNQCAVCGEVFDTGELLLDRRLRDTFEHHTVTGWGLCPQHRQMIDDGFVHLVVINLPDDTSRRIKPEDADRTGRVLHVKRHMVEGLFDVSSRDVMFIDEEVEQLLLNAYTAATGEQPKEIGNE